MARLEAAVDFVDHVDATLAPHDAAIEVALFDRLEGIDDLHGTRPFCSPRLGPERAEP